VEGWEEEPREKTKRAEEPVANRQEKEWRTETAKQRGGVNGSR
jgi:hypothetical protein